MVAEWSVRRCGLKGASSGAAVAGYALTNLAQSVAIEGLARQTSMPFKRLWQLAQQEQPVPPRRLILHGEFLQLVGDTILRENERTRQYEDIGTDLGVSVAFESWSSRS